MKSIDLSNRILAVDDQVEIRRHYESIFTPKKDDLELQIDALFDAQPEAIKTSKDKPTQYFLSTAHQGHIAVDMVRQSLRTNQPFKVAFIDMRMPPGMDGFATAQEIRLLDPRIYIVFVTAYSDYSSNILDDRLEHSVLLLNKPFATDELLQLARNCCHNWDMARISALNKAPDFEPNLSLEASDLYAAIDDSLAPLQHHLNNIKNSEIEASTYPNPNEIRTSLLLDQVLKNHPTASPVEKGNG